ncbi:MAG: hypothetical protein M1813_007125 [Trichoglossum hirsutum]|nr:MAG: hypothetical protein M1813_007125 [Trichoglossum hirsutum]
MSSMFCCSNLQPFRPTRTDHEAKFTSFFEWSKFPAISAVEKPESLQDSNWSYAIQLVKQVNYGRLESKRYFVPLDDDAGFKEITERGLIEANFAKVNSYKNFRCALHDKFFELNLYQKDPVNRHHWRANIARPAADIDLDTSSGEQVSAQRTASDDTKIEGRQPSTIQKNIGDESKADKAKPATDFDDSIARVLARLPKMSLEEATEGVSSTSLDERAGQMPVTVSGDLWRVKEEDGDDDEYDERDDYGRDRYESSNDGGEDLDYTACSLECGYCGHCDY